MRNSISHYHPAGVRTYVLDIGNSAIKAAEFEAGRLLSIEQLTALPEVALWLSQRNPARGWAGLCSTRKLPNGFIENLNLRHPHWLRVHGNLPGLPYEMGYATPETLGPDRVAAVAGARLLVPEGPLLVLDLGTAFTTEYLDAHNTYRGGSIAPGLRMRFQALNNYTDKLPLVEPRLGPEMWAKAGDSTPNALNAGVLGGMLLELQAWIDLYTDTNQGRLAVFLTGGDAPYFENHLKNLNFVHENLVLQGIDYLVRIHANA